MFMASYPDLGQLYIMGLHTPQSAVLSAVISQCVDHRRIGPAGVAGRPLPAEQHAGAILRRNLLIYGVGGIIAPFPGIWIIDRIVHVLGLA